MRCRLPTIPPTCCFDPHSSRCHQCRWIVVEVTAGAAQSATGIIQDASVMTLPSGQVAVGYTITLEYQP
jgi:hypothetical protein